MSHRHHKRKNRKPSGLMNAVAKLRLKHGERRSMHELRIHKGKTREISPEQQEPLVSHHSSSASDAGNDGFTDTQFNCLD